MRMNQTKWIAVGTAALLAVTLSACGGSTADNNDSNGTNNEAPIGGDIVAPVTKSASELQGANIELIVGQVLNINTDSLAVDSYTAEIADESIAEFSQGGSSGGAEFNPGVTALRLGSTKVKLVNEQSGIQPLEFTVTVVAN